MPFNIARKFDIALDELRNYNGWDADYSGSRATAARCGSRRAPSSSTPTPRRRRRPERRTTPPTSTDSTPADGSADGDRCHPTYEVEEATPRCVITSKFDITLEQLNAANASTPNWPNLYTGSSISRPAPADCANAVATTTIVVAAADSPDSGTLCSAAVISRRMRKRVDGSGHGSAVGVSRGRASGASGGGARPAMPWRRRVGERPLPAPAGVLGAAERRARAVGGAAAGRPVVGRRLVGRAS